MARCPTSRSWTRTSTTYSEENPQDIRKGESFAAEVINAVLHGRGWPHTLLIWLYDEHGGYYDHVPPPAAVPPDDVEGRSAIGGRRGWRRCCGRSSPACSGSEKNLTRARTYDRYGFRVPAVIVSPYARPDYVCPTCSTTRRCSGWSSRSGTCLR